MSRIPPRSAQPGIRDRLSNPCDTLVDTLQKEQARSIGVDSLVKQHGFETAWERFGGSRRQDEEVEDGEGDGGGQRSPSTLGDAMAYSS